MWHFFYLRLAQPEGRPQRSPALGQGVAEVAPEQAWQEEMEWLALSLSQDRVSEQQSVCSQPLRGHPVETFSVGWEESGGRGSCRA